MKSKVDTKVCGVCGDKALGYNFNAVTCESCKAFFRRNALVQKQFKCPFNDQCEITTITRRFCQKCRLDKCFAIGMCKDLIMSEEDKHLKRQKIEENRARKRSKIHGFKSGFKKVKKESVEADSQSGYSFIDSDSSKDMGYQPNGTPNPVTVDLGNERLVTSSDDVSMIRNMLNNTPNSATGSKSVDDSALISLINNNDVNCNNNDPTSSSKSTLDVTKDVVEDVHRVSIEPNSIESILCEAIKLEFEAYSSIAQCHSNSRELNDAERAKLNELIVANKALLNPLDDELNTLIGNDYKFRGNPQQALETDPALVDVINLTAIVIRRLIKMAKKINAFKNMCQEDQVALLKGGCTEIMILRSAMNYDPTKQTWKIPHSQETFNLNVDILKLAKGNVYQEHERFINTFDPKWRSDENIVLILCAITLFTPDRPRVVHQDVIKLEQNAYYYLLRRYLESIYPGCEAKSTFLKLIQKIAELHRFNEELINVYLDVNPSQVEPLLIEIFDLKH
uniref:Nuclear hormone receptor HR96 n=1 Tax=Tribolium castaneum TaxID=7070 RepID=A0A8F5FT57_TRICA|nr:nuclear hormone receptor HR96 [Tribolium castaneum]